MEFEGEDHARWSRQFSYQRQVATKIVQRIDAAPEKSLNVEQYIRSLNMRTLLTSLLFCIYISRAYRTARAGEVEAKLPGANLTVNKAIRFSGTDLVAEVELAALGVPDPPRMPGVKTYPNAEWRIIKVFKGHAKGIIHKSLDLNETPQ
jgi:hypothetical protein